MTSSATSKFAALRTAAKVLISGGLLVFLVRSVDADSMLVALAQADPLLMLGVVALLFALIPVLALRWNTIMAALQIRVEYWRAFRVVLIGMFFNQLLPSAIGGDAYRVWALGKRGLPFSHVLNTVVLDRGVALIATLAVTAFGLSRIDELIPPGTARVLSMTLLALVVGGVCAGMLLLFFAARMPDGGLFSRYALLRMIKKSAADVVLLVRNPKALMFVVLVSVVLNISTSASIWLIAVALGKHPGLLDCIYVIPTVMVFAMIPISVAGWGVREGGMVVALGLLGIEPAAALATSLLFGASLVAIGIPGGVAWFLSGERARVPAESGGRQ